MSKKKLIDLYPYRWINNEIEFLLFKRAKGKIYQGQWRMIGGKVNTGETYWDASLRELNEETGLKPEKLWTIPGINSFYEHKTDTIHHIPAFAAEMNPNSKPALDDEHTEFGWFTLDNSLKHILWPEQKRLLQLTHDTLKSHQILDDWYVPIS
jgi:dihydroneopterin triphosphate diphosphatase